MRGDGAFDPRGRILDPAQLFERDREPQVIRHVGARVGCVAPGRERRDERIAVADLLVQRSQLGELTCVERLDLARAAQRLARALGIVRAVARELGHVQPDLAAALRVRSAEHLDLALVQVERAAPVLHRLEQPLERSQRCEVGRVRLQRSARSSGSRAWSRRGGASGCPRARAEARRGRAGSRSGAPSSSRSKRLGHLAPATEPLGGAAQAAQRSIWAGSQSSARR
jgi:hypothetical protein